MDHPNEGDTHTFERTFTRADVEQFTAVSRDDQPRHTEPDDSGRLLVHGLLTATMPTKIGGDLEMLASSMEFDLRRPVYTGQSISCRWTNQSVEERDDRFDVDVEAVCRNEAGEVVLTASIEGLVWKRS